jgi:hypothetical protein
MSKTAKFGKIKTQGILGINMTFISKTLYSRCNKNLGCNLGCYLWHFKKFHTFDFVKNL